MTIIEKLNKAMGNKVAAQGDDIEKVETIPTGILALDLALGVGGFPRGRIVDIYGLPSVGKSTVCYTLIASAQRRGIACAIIDAENAYTKEYAADFGIDTAKLVVVSPPCLEQGAEAIEILAKEGFGLIVVDSMSSLVPRALAEAEHGKPPMARQALGISQALLKLVPILAVTNTCLVGINQMRVNIMAMGYADKYTVSGGWAMKFYSSVRIEMKRKQAIMVKDEQIGYIVSFRMKKNKLSRPDVECEVEYLYGKGFNPEGDVVRLALDAEIFTQAGGWIHYGETKWHGKAEADEKLRENPALRSEILAQLSGNLQ